MSITMEDDIKRWSNDGPHSASRLAIALGLLYMFLYAEAFLTANNQSRFEKIIITAGPNGAGKTTFARDFLPAEAQTLKFINADLIAAGRD